VGSIIEVFLERAGMVCHGWFRMVFEWSGCGINGWQVGGSICFAMAENAVSNV
jgi:hypothetical protein